MLMTLNSMAHVRLLRSTRSQRRFPTTRWHCGLGEVEQADAEPGQIRSHLLYNKSASSSTTNRCDTDRWHPNHSGAVRPWSRHLHWCRLVDAGARQTNGVAVLRCSPLIAPDPPSGADCRHVTDACSGSTAMQYWSAFQPTWYDVCNRCSTRRHDSSTICDLVVL